MKCGNWYVCCNIQIHTLVAATSVLWFCGVLLVCVVHIFACTKRYDLCVLQPSHGSRPIALHLQYESNVFYKLNLYDTMHMMCVILPTKHLFIFSSKFHFIAGHRQIQVRDTIITLSQVVQAI